MNALELADELKTLDHDDWYEWMTEAATMLRQQQAEIEALNIELAHYKPNGEMGTVFIFEDEQEK